MLQEPLVKSTEAENLVRTAFRAGVPQDQLETFLTRAYVPLPWQFRFHAAAREADKPNGPVDIGAGGARGPGKSHAVLAQIALDDCQRIPRLKGLFLRQTGKSASESFEDLIEKVLKGRIQYTYNSSKNVLKFPNGSRILLGGFEDEGDIDKYVGIEYDIIAVEERNQLSGEKILKLKGSLRTSKPNWRPRMYSSFNPGGLGHLDVKETFVLPFRAGEEARTRFIPATYRDNLAYLNREYIEYLETLPGALGKAWRDGDWDSFAGQYFSEWNHEKHVVKPFEIPKSWKKYRAYDHGRTKPACCKWYAVDYDGRVWVYREFYAAGLNVDDCAIHADTSLCDVSCESNRKGIANEINRLSEGETYEYSVADPAIFATHGMVDKYGGQTIAETFARRNVFFLPWSNRRVDGWNLMHQYLAHSETKEPLIRYFSTCYNSIRTTPALIHDERHPEDLDTDGEDHAADTDRGFLMSLHERKTSKPKTGAAAKIEEMKRKVAVKPTTFNQFYNP